MTTDSPSEMLTDSRATAAGASDPNPAPPFFPVSVAKMAILSFVTFNLYPVYWFYQNWRLVKMREGSDILPFWRAIFGYFSATNSSDASAMREKRPGPPATYRSAY